MSDDSELLAASLNQRAMLSLESHSFNTALSLLHQANFILKNKKPSESLIQLKCTTLNNLGCVYKRLEKPKKGLFYLNEALSIGTRYGSFIDTSSIHLNISAIKSMLSAHEEALYHALSSLKLCSLNFSNDKTIPLLSSYYQAGSECFYLHKITDARRYFQSGFELASKHLGKAHQITLKFFKSLYDKNLREVPKIKKTVLGPIFEKRQKFRGNVKSVEPKNEFKIRKIEENASSGGVQRKLGKSRTNSTKSLVSKKVKSQIKYIKNALSVIQKKICVDNEKEQSDIIKTPIITPVSSQDFDKNRTWAGVLVQKTLRMWKDRKKFLDIKRKVVKIQKKFREIRYLKHLKNTKNRVSGFSQQFNAEILAKYYEDKKRNMVEGKCQTRFQVVFLDGVKVLPKKPENFFGCLIRVQRAVKAWVVRKKKLRSVFMIQKGFRMFLDRKKYLEKVRVFRSRKRVSKSVGEIWEGFGIEKIGLNRRGSYKEMLKFY